jgi:hypothetical protein
LARYDPSDQSGSCHVQATKRETVSISRDTEGPALSIST